VDREEKCLAEDGSVLMNFEANHTDFDNATGYYKESFILNDKSVYIHEEDDSFIIFYEHPCWILSQGSTKFPLKELQDQVIPKQLQSCGNTTAAIAACNEWAISPDLAGGYCGHWLPTNMTKYRTLFERQVMVVTLEPTAAPTLTPTVFTVSNASENASNASTINSPASSVSNAAPSAAAFRNELSWFSFATITARWN
jgi:hypothetical protein